MSTTTRTIRHLTVQQVAEALGITDGRVRQLILSGQLHGEQLASRQWLIPPEEVKRRQREMREYRRQRSVG